MDEQIGQERGKAEETGKRIEKVMQKKEIMTTKETNERKIKTGDIVLQSQPFAFIIFTTHR